MPFGMLSRVDPVNHVIDEGSDPPMEKGNFEEEVHAPTSPRTLCRERYKNG